MEWQTIETAPKDKDILLYCPRRGVVGGRWASDRYAANQRPYWTNDREHLFGIRETRSDQPTHWAPMPEAPNSNSATPKEPNDVARPLVANLEL